MYQMPAAYECFSTKSKSVFVFDPLPCGTGCRELNHFDSSQRSVPFQAKQQGRHILEISPSPLRYLPILSISLPPPPAQCRAEQLGRDRG